MASQVVEHYQPLNFKFSDEDLICIFEAKNMIKYGSLWRMYFDRASNALGHGIGAFAISLKGNHYPFIAKLNFDCTNKIVEYEACIMGLQAAIERGNRTLQVFKDSALSFTN